MPNQAPIFSAPTFSLRRVSVTSSGAPNEGGGFNGSGNSLISAHGSVFSNDGRHLLFSSDASNLVAGDTNDASDVFIADLVTGAISRVSTDGAGSQGTGSFGSYNAIFSPDGSKILFESGFSNLAGIDNEGSLDLFVKDLATGAVTAISQVGGVTVGGHGGVFSPDGSRVAFVSASSHFVVGDENGLADIFVRDLVSGAISRISIAAGGQEGSGASWHGSSEPVFSPDGTKILFASTADLLPGEAGNRSGLYIKDLVTGELVRVSTDSANQAAYGVCEQASWSPDGARIIFTSSASTLVAGDNNQVNDVFVKELRTGIVTRVSLGSNGDELSGESGRGSFSPDGSQILFESDGEPIASAWNGNRDVFVRDLASGAVTLVSMNEDGSPGSSGSSYYGRFSPDGANVVFVSSALGLSDGPAGQYVYLASIGSNVSVFRENGPAVQIVGVVDVADDRGHFGGGSLEIAISSGAIAGDTLFLATDVGIVISGDQVSLNGLVVATLSVTAQTISLTLEETATASVVQSLVTAVRFVNATEHPGGPPREIRFTLIDGGGTADGGIDRAQFTRTVEVVALNDSPTQSDRLINIGEEESYVFRVDDFNFSDRDGDSFLSVELFTQNVDPALGRFLFDPDGSGGAPSFPFEGPEISVADIGAGRLSFVAGDGFWGDLSFTFRVRDDGGSDGGVDLDRAPGSSLFTFRISAENDAPVVKTSAGTTVFVEGANAGAEVAIDPALSLVDPDDPNPGAIRSATVRISDNYQPEEDWLSLPLIDGFEAFFDLATGTLHISAPSPVDTATWQLVLGNVRYTNLSDAPTLSLRTVTIRASDGIAESLPASKTISITAINDAPILDLNGAAEGSGAFTIYTERAAATLIAPDAMITDPDSLNLAGGTLLVERFANGAASDQLGIMDQGRGAGEIGVTENLITFSGVVVASFTGGGAGNLVISFNEAGTPAAAQALLRALTYHNASSSPPNPGPAYRVTLSDGDGGTSADTFLNVGMILLPDPTLFDLNGPAAGLASPIVFAEGAEALEIAPDAQLSDPDTQNFAGFSLSVSLRGASFGDNLTLLFGDGVTGLALDGDHLAYGGMLIGRISIHSPTAFTLFIDQSSVPLAAIEAVVRAVGYVNSSENPLTHDRFLGFRLFGPGEPGSLHENLIQVRAADDLPLALPDVVSVGAGGSVRFSILANDTDPDGGPKSVVTVAGTAAAVDVPLALPSGATILLHADGSLTYSANGLGVGATDSFVYSVNGGSDASVTLTIFARGADGRLIGTSASEAMNGGLVNDLFDLSAGGNDIAQGNEGNDGVYFGAALTAEDSADGGAGIDSLAIQGDYGALTLGAIRNFEVLALLSGADASQGDTRNARYDYAIRTIDSNVAGGALLKVISAGLLAGEDLVFDGSAESDGQIHIYAGRGDDQLIGGAGSDGFLFGADHNLTGADVLHGGPGGTDSIALRGHYVGSSAVTFTENSLTGIDIMVFLSGHTNEYGGFIVTSGFDYEVTLSDGNVAAGQRLEVIATNLRSNESLSFDGRAESDGSYRILAGAGDDELVGGSGSDTLYGGLGSDRIEGGDGADFYLYRASEESRSGASDQLIGFETGDRIDLSVIDAIAGSAANDAFSFIGSAAFDNVAGQLRIVQVDGGWRIEGDTDGDSVADLVIGLVTQRFEILASDFML